MLLHLLCIGIFLPLIKCSILTTNKNSSSYIGAVVEYHPITDGDDGEIIAEANVFNYKTIIKTAALYATDIIVFPEFGLTSTPKLGPRGKPFNASEYRAFYQHTASRIPNPEKKLILCDSDYSYAESLKSISCAAREYGMYVVVNHHEREDCPTRNCSPDGFLLYNTNVVFDRKGRLIARYRKFNLLHEPGTNVTREPEYSTFTTDFGVTFGQLICFDLLRENPASYFVRNPNVTDVVFSSRLFNEAPFLGSVQQQAAWAYAADVNLLAAGYNGDDRGSGGSGIYAGKNGHIRIYHPGLPSNALIVAEVPKKDRCNHSKEEVGKSSIHVFKQAEVPTIPSSSNIMPQTSKNYTLDNLVPYTSLLLDPKQEQHITTLCDRELCCDFHIKTRFNEDLANKDGTVYYRYRLSVFNGVRSYVGESTGGVEVCSVIACVGDEPEHCGKRYAADLQVVTPTTFDTLIITRKADLLTRSFYQPNTATDTLVPLNSTDFDYVVGGPKNDSLILMTLTRPQSNITTFGIYGRRFDKDGQPETKPSSSVSVAPSILLVVAGLVTLKSFVM